MYCVYNENLISRNGVQHIRQLREDRDHNRYPLVKDGRAIIRVKDGLYYGEINNGEIIAISNDIDEVVKRLKRADSNVEIIVSKGRRRLTVADYKISKLSRIFRVATSNTKDHGLIIAIDDVFDANYSDIRLFYDFDKAIRYIRRRGGKVGNYYVLSRRLERDIREQMGGIDYMDVPQGLTTDKHLKAAIKARQKAESHEDYIKQINKEKTAGKLINMYGSLESFYGGMDEPDYDQ